MGCRAVTHLSLEGSVYDEPGQTANTKGLSVVDALVEAGQRHGGPFDQLTNLELSSTYLSNSSSTKLFAFLLGENPADPLAAAALPFPLLCKLSLSEALKTSYYPPEANTLPLVDLLSGCLERGVRHLNFSSNKFPKASLRAAVAMLRKCVPQMNPPVTRGAPLLVNLAQWRPRHVRRRAADPLLGDEEWSVEDMTALRAGWPPGCKVVVELPPYSWRY